MIKILTILSVLTIALSFTNTTQFWQEKLNTTLHYQTYSGYEQIDWYHPKGSTGIYYSLWGAANHDVIVQDERVPLLIWLQGGPGSSSQFGAFTEFGPIKIKDGKPTGHEHSWNSMGHLLVIDQPLNVGFSFNHNNGQVSSARTAADHLLNFLSNFYSQWPSLRKSPLYITGQSFAGHYIPAFASKIMNNATFLKQTQINFAGVAIGDGWTDPVTQVNHYDSYLYSIGVAAETFRNIATWHQTQMIHNIYVGNYKNATPYFDFLTNNEKTREQYWGYMSTYNFRQYEDADTSFAQFLEQNKHDFGVSNDISFKAGNEDVYNSFQQDISRAYTGDIVNLLTAGKKVLIYNGQNDFVVNTAGVLNYMNGLNWRDIPQWKYSSKKIWTIGAEVKGWAKTYNNLWFVLVNGAGHMVPTDQPEPAFNMMGHFLFNDQNWKE